MLEVNKLGVIAMHDHQLSRQCRIVANADQGLYDNIMHSKRGGPALVKSASSPLLEYCVQYWAQRYCNGYGLYGKGSTPSDEKDGWVAKKVMRK